jgi:DNA polymerase eta
MVRLTHYLFRSVPLEEMQKKFGAESVWVYDILRGIDNTPGKASLRLGERSLKGYIAGIVKERTATKSMLASKNITPIITTREAGYHWLSVLAGELYVRLRDAREITEGLWPKSLVLGTRQGGSNQARWHHCKLTFLLSLRDTAIKADNISVYQKSDD